MEEQLITNDDLEYLAAESGKNLNFILAGMTSLMEDNNNKVSLLEKQNWFQRMSNTILGKNKMTQLEISQNHDKINLYVTQAMSELYSKNCIDHKLLLGLGNKINELYESQVEIKQMIGAFAQKLNQKIESIDNYHMLITEINQGVFNNANPFVSVSSIMSQLDLRTVQDKRKMDILVRALEEQKILERTEMSFSQMLEGILTLDESEAGVLALFFGNIRDEYVAEISEQTIYTYYLLPEKTRKMKSKRSIVESILKSNDIDLDYCISSYEMCESLIEAYATNVVEVAIEEQKNEEEEKKGFVQDYIDDSMKLLILLRDMVDSWEANNGEMNTHESRSEYADFMSSIIDNLDKNSYIGNSIFTNLSNITFFGQSLFAKYSDMKISKIIDESASEIINVDLDALAKVLGEVPDTGVKIPYIGVNNNVALEIGENEYKTVTEYFEGFIHDLFDNPELDRTRQLYSLQTMDAVSSEFPDPQAYTNYGLMYIHMKTYVTLFNTLFNKVREKIEDTAFMDDVYILCQKFPVKYDDDYDKILVREIDMSDAHIELEYDSFGNKHKTVGYANLGLLNHYETTTVLLKFVNVDISGYQVRMDILKNRYIETSTWTTYQFVDVDWGEWVDDDVLELKITKNNSSYIGSIEIKISIVQDPSIMAYIC